LQLNGGFAESGCTPRTGRCSFDDAKIFCGLIKQTFNLPHTPLGIYDHLWPANHWICPSTTAWLTLAVSAEY
jgi:hypothetical protein